MVAPPPTTATSPATSTERMRVRSTTRPPSRSALPAQSCPPLRTDSGSLASLATRTANCTSSGLAHRTTTAGSRSISVFHSAVASRNAGPARSTRSGPIPASVSCEATVSAVVLRIALAFLTGLLSREQAHGLSRKTTDVGLARRPVRTITASGRRTRGRWWARTRLAAIRSLLPPCLGTVSYSRSRPEMGPRLALP